MTIPHGHRALVAYPATGADRDFAPRIVHVQDGPDGEVVHLLPETQMTVHEASPACWCEPEAIDYVPFDAFPGEKYDAWYHKEVS